MGKNVHPTVEATHEAHHHMLSHVFESKGVALERLVHHYKYSFNGFSAMLTPSQAKTLSQVPEVVSIFQSKNLSPQTTRTWSYLGLDPETGVWPDSSFGEDIIIGVLDTGIWPESESFSDKGLGPIPSRWKGECVEGEQFDPLLNCNKKLIGAKWFNRGAEAAGTNMSNHIISSRDTSGHGTHVASTAAGARVDHASFFGLANGTAAGVAPRARIAVYKVCWGRCQDADLLAAFDEAVKDGVDIISISITQDVNFLEGAIDIGSFHAALQGILVSAGGGNSGPETGSTQVSVSNYVPWILTVAASTIDREYVSEIELGNGVTTQGFAVKNINFVEASWPLVSGANIPAENASSDLSRFCKPGSLDVMAATGKVVLCEQLDEVDDNGDPVSVYHVDRTVYNANGSGAIFASKNFSDSAPYPSIYSYNRDYINSAPIPAAAFADLSHAGANVTNYLATSSAPSVTIKRSKSIIQRGRSPRIAGFSSRGPSAAMRHILKPDLAAPGADILAAFTEAFPVPRSDPVINGVSTTSKYVLMSGTSMACPHASGAAAIVKSLHRDWSPAAIKSALMTTANRLTTETPQAWGAGEINILKAVDPGLVYDTTPEDYGLFLCSQGLTKLQYAQFRTDKNLSSCPAPPPPINSLNYPSVAVSIDTLTAIKTGAQVKRTVTNVGPAVSTYSAKVVSPAEFEITIVPSTLSFTQVHEKHSFTVSIKVLDTENPFESSGFLTWEDDAGLHEVKSSIFVEVQ